jgi:uncharacterized protein (DUF58 family)
VSPAGWWSDAATDSAAAAALRGLELAVTRRVDGLLQGDVLGLVPGQGTEAGESREYVAGDDVRRMDWPVTARTTVPHVRETIAERELETWVVADVSASLDFGTAQCEKRDLVLATVAAVGFLTARAGNRTGAVLAGPDGAQRLPPRPGRDGTRALLARLQSAPRTGPGTGPVLARALEQLARGNERRGLAVVISDFLDPAGWERPLRVLGTRHEVLAVEVVDPREQVLPDVGLVTLTDPESGRTLEVQTRSRRTRERYAAAAAERRRAVARGIRSAGADHLELSTDRDWLADLVRHMAGRRRRRAAGVAVRGAGTVPV